MRKAFSLVKAFVVTLVIIVQCAYWLKLPDGVVCLNIAAG